MDLDNAYLAIRMTGAGLTNASGCRTLSIFRSWVDLASIRTRRCFNDANELSKAHRNIARSYDVPPASIQGLIDKTDTIVDIQSVRNDVRKTLERIFTNIRVARNVYMLEFDQESPEVEEDFDRGVLAALRVLEGLWGDLNSEVDSTRLERQFADGPLHP